MDTPCPFCKEILFRIRPLSENATGIHIDDPHIQQKGDIDFVICPHCNKQVLMERVSGGPSGLQFRISWKQ